MRVPMFRRARPHRTRHRASRGRDCSPIGPGTRGMIHLGLMAADWIIEGLQRTGEVEVVPTLTAMAATKLPATRGGYARSGRGARPRDGREARRERLGLPGRRQPRVSGATGRCDGRQAGRRSRAGPDLRRATRGGAAAHPRSTHGPARAEHGYAGHLGRAPPALCRRIRRSAEGMDAYLQNDYRPALAASKRRMPRTRRSCCRCCTEPSATSTCSSTPGPTRCFTSLARQRCG